MSPSHSSISTLNNVAPLLLSCLTNSTRTTLRINTMPHDRVCVCVVVCVCVCVWVCVYLLVWNTKEKLVWICVSDPLSGAASRKRSLMIKCPLKQTSETSVCVDTCVSACVRTCLHVWVHQFYISTMGDTVNLSGLILYRKTGCYTWSTKSWTQSVLFPQIIVACLE